MSATSRTEEAMGGAAKGALGGGTAGVLSGGLIGAAYGAIAGLANPAGLIAGVVGTAVAITFAASPVGLGIGLVTALALPTLGALGGMLAGMGIGGGIGAGFFGAKGALAGGRESDEREQRFALKQQNSLAARQELAGQARGEAAEYYTAAGYQTGFEEGKNAVVNQIIAAKQQEMMMAAQAGQQPGFAQRVKKADSHVQAAEQAPSAAPGQTAV